MLNIKVSKSIPAKAEHECHFISDAASLSKIKILAPFQDHLKKKIKDKKNQIIRLINGKKHLLAVIVYHDSDDLDSQNFEGLRKLGNQIGHKLNSENAKEVYVSGYDAVDNQQYLCVLEGLMLGNYQFNKYKKNKNENTLSNVLLIGSAPKASEIKEVSNVVECNLTARSLVNEPVNTMNSIQLGKEITKLSKKNGFSVKILNKAAIEKLKMGGLLGVNYGSIDPPLFAIMEWKSPKAKNKKPYVLVGKGVVYDTGGYSIKTGAYMATMKSDMGGAAAVIGTMSAISKNNLPIHVVGLTPITDNRIGKNALVPDDIIKISDGTTVEVLNTDAEGRLILADALVYAKKYNPKLVIDLATLTGAAAAITGPYGSAFMGNATDADKSDLKKSGDAVYERLAELPFWEEYEALLKSKVADLKNIGGPKGGATTAGKFLEHFTDYPWIHIDIAGPAFIDGMDSYKSAGGTGVGVRLLYHFLKFKSGK